MSIIMKAEAVLAPYRDRIADLERRLSTARADSYETAARMLKLSPSEVRLMAGELTPGEMRTVQAVLKSLASGIRALIPPQEK